MTGKSQKVLWNDKTSKFCPLTHGVPKGSILGPPLFLVMVADMPKYVIGNTPNSKMVGYGDDSTAYVHSKDVCSLKQNLENISNRNPPKRPFLGGNDILDTEFYRSVSR